MKLLKEKFLHRGIYCYSRYDGYFEHTKENGEVMLLHIIIDTQYEDIDVYLFTKDNGFKKIAHSLNIEGLSPIHSYYEKNEFIEIVKTNINVIEEWLDVVFH